MDKEHGDKAAEAARGQRAVTAGDYARLPGIINNPDRMWVDGGEVLMEKDFAGERQVLVFVPITGRRMLNLKSMLIISRQPSRPTS
ncbi:MAG: hypothetical protein ACOY4W_05185 [Thermodesulfobacteriota bacterium]